MAAAVDVHMTQGQSHGHRSMHDEVLEFARARWLILVGVLLCYVPEVEICGLSAWNMSGKRQAEDFSHFVHPFKFPSATGITPAVSPSRFLACLH
eukprot:767766-Hanusia_phi.AAC.2